VVNYAKEYGIDIEALWREHPSNPDQLRLKREQDAAGENYRLWTEKVRAEEAANIAIALDRYKREFSKPQPKQNTRRAEPVVKPKPKPAKKTKPPKFTEEQLAIARRSLEDSGDAQKKNMAKYTGKARRV